VGQKLTSFVKCILNVRGLYDEHTNMFRKRFLTTTLQFERLLGMGHVDCRQEKSMFKKLLMEGNLQLMNDV